MGTWPITRIPHVVDTDVFSPESRSLARPHFGIVETANVITFVASAGIIDHRKGFDLLWDALPTVVEALGPVTLLIVGPTGEVSHLPDVRVVWTGPITSDEVLRHAYCASDVVAVPSRADNLPLSAMEAQTCGRAVVAFAAGGLPDIVVHQVTGYLAQPTDVSDFAQGLIQAISDSHNQDQWGVGARANARATWDPRIVVASYLETYRAVGVMTE